jgi:flagellar hook-associated protein 3 FlgL
MSSIYRISTNTIPDNGMYHLRNRETSMDKVNNQLNTGKKHELPRDDVIDVSQAMTVHSKLHKINQYMKNIQDAESERSQVESKIMNTVDILQRIRELAVQGANGVYTAEDRKNMAEEIDQLMKDIILNSNSKYKGNYLFSGFKKYTQPFEILEGAVKGANQAMITEVRYLGDNGRQLREVDNNEYITSAMPGGEIFWGENFQIYSQVNTANFRLTRDMSISIDGVRLDFNQGDNIYAIMDKINKSAAAVNASVDIVSGGLILKSTKPHKLELTDLEGGTLLQDLGILERGFPSGPDNYNNTATVFGGSIFDTLIGLRNSMLSNNMEDIGGRYLGAIDYTISNLMFHTAESGALSNRLTYLQERFTKDKEAYTESLAKLEDTDVAEALTNLSMLNFAHKVALSSLARISQTSLMDFLR